MNGLTYYANKAKQYAFISRDEQLELARKYQQGNVAAGNKLITSNLRFAMKQAHKYARMGFSLEDLIQEANEGLCIALKKFDPSRGFTFITYARWRVMVQLQRYCAAHSSITNYGSLRSSLVDVSARAARKMMPQATESEIAEHVAEGLGMQLDTVMTILGRRWKDFSLNTKLVEDGETTHQDMLADEGATPEEAAIATDLAEKVDGKLSAVPLSPRERDIVEHRLKAGDDSATLLTLARRHGVSRERIRQVEVILKQKLANPLLEVAS